MSEEVRLKIREANIDDYINIKNLVIEVYKLHLENRPDVYRDIDNPFEKQKFNKILQDKNIKVFLVEDVKDKKILAYSILKISTALNPILIKRNFVYIDDFCVEKDCKRRGIGKLLFKYITSYAKEKAILSIRLNVWEFNKDAFEFYKKMGMSTRNRTMELKL